VNAREEFCTIFGGNPEEAITGRYFYGSTFGTPTGQKDWGALRAIDPHTGGIKWEFKMYSAGWGGVLSTAGRLVFTGDNEGNLMAFDAATGKHLWHFQLGSPVFAAPISYSLNGKQYVVIPAGSALFAFALPGSN
jgi:alcohol dehydrogenase (cytochrome c)